MIITTNFIPAGYDAVTVWPFIFVRPECRDNDGLIHHELVHYYSQAWVTPFWFLRYWFSPEFRWAQEVAGYRVQVGRGGITKERAAEYLVTYDTGHTYEEALETLSRTDAELAPSA